MQNKRDSWPEEVRTKALELWKEHGTSVAAERTGVPAGTVASWAHRAGLDSGSYLRHTEVAIEANKRRNELRRAEMAAKAAHLAAVAYERAADALEDDRAADAKTYAVTAAILTDKHLLLSGEATSRHETRSTPEQQRLRVAELLAALEARRPDRP